MKPHTNPTAHPATVSCTQIMYLKKRKTRRRLICICRLLILIVFVALWELSAGRGWIDSYIFSSPSRILSCTLDMLQTKLLLYHIGITLFETLISFAAVMLLSLLVAMLLWFCHTLDLILEPYLVVCNSLPKSALAPLLIVWLGTDYKTIIITGMSVAIFGSIMNLCTCFHHTDPEKEKLIYSLGGSRLDALLLLVLPANFSHIYNLMKVNIGLCLVGVIIGEFISSRSGLGYLIIYGSQVFKLDWVIMSIVLLCLIAMGLYQGITLLEKKMR